MQRKKNPKKKKRNMSIEKPLGWGDFDIDNRNHNDNFPSTDHKWYDIQRELPQDAGEPEVLNVPEIPVGAGFVGMMFGSASNVLEWFAMKVPVKTFLRDEVDELTMRGASILLFICLLLALIISLTVYGCYKRYKNRSGYNKVLWYVGNQVNIPNRYQKTNEKKKKKRF
jgi:hypothetical protein